MSTNKADVAAGFERLSKEMAERDTKAAERDRRNVIVVLTGLAVAVGVIGLLVRWPF